MLSSLVSRWLCVCALTVASTAGVGAGAEAPPGFNVHLVREQNGHRFWRGGAPREDTLLALARSARERGVLLTFIDLRAPANSDDKSKKGGRLSPDEEKALAEKHSARYVQISALKKPMVTVINEALVKGDVYIHCMYGVNRTGFACARYATAGGFDIDREGLGKRDWEQGERFQKAQK